MDKLRKFSAAVFLRVQKVLLPAFLAPAYLIGLGFMALGARIPGISPVRKPMCGDTFWLPAEGGPADAAEAGEQS